MNKNPTTYRVEGGYFERICGRGEQNLGAVSNLL
jgi:hypothetical protein